MDIGDAAPCQCVERMRGDVGVNHIAWRLHQYTWHVQRNLAIADNSRDFAREIERTVAIAWVPIVPSDEFGCGMAAGEFSPRMSMVRGASFIRERKPNHNFCIQ